MAPRKSKAIHGRGVFNTLKKAAVSLAKKPSEILTFFGADKHPKLTAFASHLLKSKGYGAKAGDTIDVPAEMFRQDGNGLKEVWGTIKKGAKYVSNVAGKLGLKPSQIAAAAGHPELSGAFLAAGHGMYSSSPFGMYNPNSSVNDLHMRGKGSKLILGANGNMY